PMKLVRNGDTDREVLGMILDQVRTREEREGDLAAQAGACRVGEIRLQELVSQHGREKSSRLCSELLNYSERLMRADLAQMPNGRFSAEDFLDDDGFGSDPIRIHVSLTFDSASKSAHVDFTGSGLQVASSMNAVYAITYSATYYVFRCLL